MARRLVLASRSKHKVGELQQLLGLADVVLVTPDEVGVEGEPVEDADSFEGNAGIKVRYYGERSGLPTLADDSGLEVDALGGGPGVQTKRYAGPEASDEDNNSKLLLELEGLPAEERGARYQCVLAFWDPRKGEEPVFRSGAFEGRIATERRGTGGFGYDPIFEPEDEAPGGRTVGQMTSEEKHALSHRGKAARAMAEYLEGEGW
jgi:XTP/dITP diphosphohydrolase